MSGDLVLLRKKAEQAVADMAEGPLKIKAFEVILTSLLSPGTADREPQKKQLRFESSPQREVVSSIARRIALLAEEAFFSQPRSLADIQAGLAEHGWHYPQNNLSTPLIRLVRERQLRRLQLTKGNKKVWKYSLP
jgi:hypothetical protein